MFYVFWRHLVQFMAQLHWRDSKFSSCSGMLSFFGTFPNSVCPKRHFVLNLEHVKFGQNIGINHFCLCLCQYIVRSGRYHRDITTYMRQQNYSLYLYYSSSAHSYSKACVSISLMIVTCCIMLLQLWLLYVMDGPTHGHAFSLSWTRRLNFILSSL